MAGHESVKVEKHWNRILALSIFDALFQIDGMQNFFFTIEFLVLCHFKVSKNT